MGGFMRAMSVGLLALLALGACAQTPDTPDCVLAIGNRVPAPPGHQEAPVPVQAAETPTVATAAPPAWIGRLTDATKANALKLDYASGVFSGPGWDKLVAEGRAAQFLLVGEEHGIAENPKLMGQLFETLAKDGYSKFVIEVSPPMADALTASAQTGMAGIKAQYALDGGEPAFFGMQEEAEMLVRARAAGATFWGVDYEVGGDRLLLAKLEAMTKPKAAEEALAKLHAASAASWAKYYAEKNPQFMYSFNGDPALVRAVRDAWPQRSAEASGILTTLEETFAINQMWVAGKGFESNARRSAFMRDNFLTHWNAVREQKPASKVFVKMGLSHLVRGRNMSEVYDLGALVPELAQIEGVKALQVGILQGKGSPTAVFDPVAWRYNPSDPKDNYMQGLDALYAGAYPDAFTLIDLRAVRPAVSRWREGMDPELIRIVHGLDLLLIMSGSTPSANLAR
jgi:hypothetical protein